MRTGTLALLLFAFGCNAEIGGVDRQSGGTDASMETEPDAATPTIDAPTSGPGGTTIPTAACIAKGYVAVTGLTSLYRVVAMEQEWVNAHAACAADVSGSTHLVVLSSTAESTYAQDRLGWIGLSDRTTEGTFANVTAEPNDQRPFSSGQPDDGSGSEDCVQMKDNGLDDDQCENGHTYICECDGRPPAL